MGGVEAASSKLLRAHTRCGYSGSATAAPFWRGFEKVRRCSSGGELQQLTPPQTTTTCGYIFERRAKPSSPGVGCGDMETAPSIPDFLTCAVPYIMISCRGNRNSLPGGFNKRIFAAVFEIPAHATQCLFVRTPWAWRRAPRRS